MAETIARIQLLIDTTAHWQASNPILLSGEIGLEIKTNHEIAFKVGNGTTSWNLLDYAVFTPSEVVAIRDELQDQIDNIVIAASEGGDSSIEVSQARVNASGTTYETLKARLDAMDETSETLETKTDELVNASHLQIVYDYSTFMFGHIGADGRVTSSNKHICFKDKVKIEGSNISVDLGYKYQYALYDINSGAFISRQTWKTDKTVISGDYLIIIEIADVSESVLSDFSIAEHLHANLYWDNSPVSEVVRDFVNMPINFVNNKNIKTAYDVGEIIDLTPEDVSVYSYAIQEVSENDMILINGTGGSNPRIWCFIDNENRVVQVANSFTSGKHYENLVLNVPNGATKIIINSITSALGDCCLLGLQSKVDNLQTTTKNNVERNSEIIWEEESNQLRQSNNIVYTLGINTFKNKMLEIAQPANYKSWPFIGTVANRLVCLFAAGTSHTDLYSNIYYKTSENGVIWSSEKKIISSDDVRDNITGKGYDNDGNLLFWIRRGFPGASTTKFELYKTIDGNTFEKVFSQLFPTANGHIGDIVNVPEHGLFAFWNSYGDARSWGYVKSTDNGETWTETILETEQKKTDCPVEMSPVYLGNGKILVMGRQDEDETYGTFQIQSNDYGKTFTKSSTNIYVRSATPSVLYDSDTDTLSLYYFDRWVGELKLITTLSETIWDAPTAWGDATAIVQVESRGQDCGNVNACQFGDIQLASFYSGNETDTGIYVVIN